MKWVKQRNLIATAEELITTFEISSEKAAKQKPDIVKMPFGIKTSKPRKQRDREQQQRRNRAKARAQMQHGSVRDQEATSSDNEPLHDGQPFMDGDNNASNAGDNFDVPDGASAQNAVEGDDIDMTEESHPVEPISETAQAEEQVVRDVENEIKQIEDKKAELADSYRSGQAPVPQGTYFSTEVGLAEGAIAVSGRSICFQCKNKISKGEVRFVWYHSVVKPSAWVHAHCVYQLVQLSSSEVKERAVQKLSEQIQSQRKKPGDDSLKEIQGEAEKILHMLQG